MEMILNTKNYSLIFFDPNVILYGHIDGNLCVYQDEAEEFAKNFFSEGILSKEYGGEKDLMSAKHWLVGILYHFRENSISEIMNLTGYKSSNAVREVITKFGPPKGIKESTEIAFQKRYGKSIPQVMEEGFERKFGKTMSESMTERWKFMDNATRKSISRAASEGLKEYWRKRKNLIVKS